VSSSLLSILVIPVNNILPHPIKGIHLNRTGVSSNIGYSNKHWELMAINSSSQLYLANYEILV
ncbi:hypothetical protein, partial [Lachnospira sp.]|uniref:hypothetical protein n=1 Tax=Lachnospira sp. TaxID=2049031 RepID=UPI0025809CB5